MRYINSLPLQMTEGDKSNSVKRFEISSYTLILYNISRICFSCMRTKAFYWPATFAASHITRACAQLLVCIDLVPRANVTLVLRNGKMKNPRGLNLPVPHEEGNVGSGDEITLAFTVFERMRDCSQSRLGYKDTFELLFLCIKVTL